MGNMSWETIDVNKSLQIAEHIDIDSVLERLSIITKKNKNYIKKVIDNDEIKLILASILNHNGLNKKEDVDNFINNPSGCFISPFELTNAKKASDLILSYITNPNSHIVIKADYDADGIMAGFITYSALKKVSAGLVEVLFPERREGYGLNINDCNIIIKSKMLTKRDVLVITVDNGITKVNEVNELKKNGIEVLITDHHKSDAETGVPNCLIVDPHNEYEKQSIDTKHLCGTQVAFKILNILFNELNEDVLEYVPYVAIACLADVMPMTAENNAFVEYGLEMINRDVAGDFFTILKDCIDCNIITTEQILWSIAPMINACGRLDKTYVATDALFNPSEETIIHIIAVNIDRRDITKAFKEKVSDMECDDNIIVHVANEEECPRGTVGIYAAKIAEKFNRPAITVLEHDGKCHGSIRSANNINMYAVAKKLYDIGLFKNYAGHEGACVCDFNIEDIDAIRDKLNSLDLIEYISEMPENENKITLDITLQHLTEVVYVIISLISLENKTLKLPNFVIKDLNATMTRSKNNPDNVKLDLNDGNRCKSLWAWGLGDKAEEVIKNNNGIINIIGSIKKNFMGTGYVLDIKDII